MTEPSFIDAIKGAFLALPHQEQQKVIEQLQQLLDQQKADRRSHSFGRIS